MTGPTRDNGQSLPVLAVVLAVLGFSCTPADPEGASVSAGILLTAPTTCPSCRIAVDHELTIGLGDTILVDWPQDVARDSRGRYYLAVPNKQELPMVYGPDGTFLGRIGKVGDGPGELRYAAFLAMVPGDTLYVHDRANRLVVFGPDGRYVRQHPFPPSGWGLRALTGGQLLLNGTVLAAGARGRPFHLYSADGAYTQSLGDSIDLRDRQYSLKVIHRIWPDHDGGFWAASGFGRYELEHWSRSKLETHYLVRRSWFTPVVPEIVDPDLNQLDQIDGLALDATNRLWVYVAIPDPTRGSSPTESMSSPEGSVQVPRNWDAYYDTVIEVFESATGRLLASRRLDERFRYVLGPDRVARIEQEEDGKLLLMVYRVRLMDGDS